MNQLCNCGSGEERYVLCDARGIFVSYVCDQCVEDMKAKYRPEIFVDPGYVCDEPIEMDD